MEEIKCIDKYIKELKNINIIDDIKLRDIIFEKVIGTMFVEDDIRRLRLSYFTCYGDQIDYYGDANKLISKLEYKKAVLLDEYEKNKKREIAEHEQREIEKMRLQLELEKKNIITHNSNHNEANSVVTASISFENVRNEVDSMTALSNNDIQEIHKKINEIKEIVNSNDTKSKKWDSAKGIINWISDKGVDVGIALLPLRLNIS